MIPNKHSLIYFQKDQETNDLTPLTSRPQRTSTLQDLMTATEISQALGIAPKTLRNWISLRKIPFVKIGRKTMFRPKSIESWLERKEFKACQ